MVVVQSFTYPYTIDLNTAKNCCVGELVPDGRMIPFCPFNSAGYREQVRSELAKLASD